MSSIILRTQLLVGSALLGLVASGCQQKNEFVPPPPPAVTVAKPLERQVTDYFETWKIHIEYPIRPMRCSRSK
ncbi:MAG: hypothetical protein H0T47_08320 [Planctomycetaceae bacterium]|nr:hypothetical protein [Planctomycetaceae bacterium]